MKKLILSTVAVGALSTGCFVEREYGNGFDPLDIETIAGLRGSAGPITDFDQQFAADGTRVQTGYGAPAESPEPGLGSAYVEKYDGRVYANFVVEDPRGNVYVNVEIANPDRMEVGEAYTVRFDENDQASYEAVNGEEPTILVYACPDSPVPASGNAEELTVVLEQEDPRGGQRFSFTADAPNERQRLAMDGFVVAREGTTSTQSYEY